MIETSRRSLITGLVALVAAPAIVKVASLMPVKASLQPRLLTITDITREAVRRFKNSNAFLDRIDKEYHENLAFVNGCQWGKLVHIRLPVNYNGFVPLITSEGRIIPDVTPLALAAAAVAVAPKVLDKPVTRRFWDS